MTKRPNARLLVVDDHREMAELLADQLRDLGYVVDVADSGGEALAQVERRLPDVVVTDLRMEQIDGLDVLEGIRRIDPQVPVILMTAFGAVDTAIEAIRRGAYHYLTKPFSFDELLLYIERALSERQLRDEHRALQLELQERGEHHLLVGQSASMEALERLLARIAPSDAPVLILGESGTGKELVARTLHAASPRRERRFVPVNCAALPEALLESELFGHVKGAFTGATGPRRGLFVEADGGTLFLDEIAEMPSSLQARLLRVLEDGEIRAVGADVTRRVDVRILAATHRDIEARIGQGLFREDLYYRLNVVPVHIPPLRDRPDDIVLLASYLMECARRTSPGAILRQLGPDAIAVLESQPWPGNVRELDNLIRRMVLLCHVEVADAAELQRLGWLAPPRATQASAGAATPPDMTATTSRLTVALPLTRPQEPPPPVGSVTDAAVMAAPPNDHSTRTEQGLEQAFDSWATADGAVLERCPSLGEAEQAYINWVVRRCGGNKTQAAVLLGIDVSTIHRRERRQR